MRVGRAVRCAASLASVALLLGCKRHVGPSGAPPSPSGGAGATVASEAPPLDHLGAGELPPGTAKVFGLVLPRGMKLVAHFGADAEAIGPLRPEEVANYVRDRVTATRIELGAVGTVFPAVSVKDGDPTKTLRIEVVPLGTRTKIVVRDITAPGAHVEIDPNETDEMRWQKAGYDKAGVPKDRLKLK